MATRTTRTLQDRADAIARMIRALPRDPSEWDPDDLRLLMQIEAAVNTARTLAVLGMREHGVTDTAIAEALGITQQAVSKRWPGQGRYVGAAGRYRKPKIPTGGPF